MYNISIPHTTHIFPLQSRQDQKYTQVKLYTRGRGGGVAVHSGEYSQGVVSLTANH